MARVLEARLSSRLAPKFSISRWLLYDTEGIPGLRALGSNYVAQFTGRETNAGLFVIEDVKLGV